MADSYWFVEIIDQLDSKNSVPKQFLFIYIYIINIAYTALNCYSIQMILNNRGRIHS